MASKHKELARKRKSEKQTAITSGKKSKTQSKYAKKSRRKSTNPNSPFYGTNVKVKKITVGSSEPFDSKYM